VRNTRPRTCGGGGGGKGVCTCMCVCEHKDVNGLEKQAITGCVRNGQLSTVMLPAGSKNHPPRSTCGKRNNFSTAQHKLLHHHL